MRIDYEGRKIACSVGDLAYEASRRRIGAERGEGFRRMWIGQEIHSRRAEERASEDPNYRPEVTVSCERQVGDWTVLVSGRIDGLSIDHALRTVLLEEVKSVHFDLELEALYRSQKLQHHLYQLMLYAWFLSRRDDLTGYTFAAQLVLIDLVTSEARIVESPFVPDEVESALTASLEALVTLTESDEALRIAKRSFASSLAFPYEKLRPFQQELMTAVEHGVREREALLVAAPTGVGKTIAAIYPALRESLRLGKKLFYLTSKTLQQEIAVASLSLLNDGSFRVLRIRAKQKMCAHTQMICHEDFCPFADRYAEKVEKSGIVSRIVTDMGYFDPDITFEMSRSTEVCPFEVSLELIEHADVIVCDYNYIFDPYVGLKTYKDVDEYDDCVLIVDEAHNLVDRGRGYYSPELSSANFAAVRNHLWSRSCPLDDWEYLLMELEEHFQTLAFPLESLSGGTESNRDRSSWNRGQSTQALCEPDRRLFMRQRTAWERLILHYIGWKIENRLADEEDPLIDFYFKLVKFTNLLSETGEEFSHIIEKNDDGLKLKIFCKDPSKFLGKILESAHSVIAISATLEPFAFYRQILGFPRERSVELSLPSPFPKENRKIMVIPEVNTTWKERGRHYEKIGELVGTMADSSPGNFLALFPSYAFLQEVATRLPITRKDLTVQRSDMTDFERSSLLRSMRARTDQLIFAVSGGMYAEGIDYEGDMLSGVFVVGPSLPAVSFEQELLKQYYDEQYASGFEYAYLIPGMTRVIQSAGRVIRSESDIGVIALLCKRFTFQDYTRFFPSHWYDSSPRELVTKKPADEIRSFFEARRSPQLRIRGF